jgi:hypothetical protein
MYLSRQNLIPRDSSSKLSSRFIYHPAMVTGAKLSLKAIIILVFFLTLLVISLTIVCCCCLRSRRRRVTKRKANTQIPLRKISNDEEERAYVFETFKRETWERDVRRNRFWKGRERRKMEERAKKVREEWAGRRERDGFGRPLDGGDGGIRMVKPERVKTRRTEWKMWNMPQ